MKWINSAENPLIKEINKIKKNPEEKILIEGLNLVKTAVEEQFNKNKDYLKVERVLITKNFILKNKEFFNFLKGGNYEIVGIAEKIAKKISDTVTPQGIFALLSYKIKNLSEGFIDNPQILVILDKIQDPGNLGTIIRTSEAFGAQAIILTPGSCNPLSSKAIRASAGSIFYIPILKAEIGEIENFIKKYGLTLIITEPKAKKMIFEISLSTPLAIVFGNEAHGAGNYFKQLPHVSCRIPHIGRSESLNVAMSASIILYEVLKVNIKNKEKNLN
ncbi:MAG: RNA methyltransferase [Thermodesulfovibrio sp.]|nr:RNA methyltransferase [Thermodesulfovibrio sp.]